MRVELQAQHEPDDETARSQTGKTLSEWYEIVDAAGGPAQGRKAIGELLLRTHKVDAWWTTTITVEYEKARGQLEKDGRPRGYAICVTKNINAPASRVWQAFTAPSGSSGWHAAGLTGQAAEGVSITDADGNRATFHRLIPNKTLKFGWERSGGGQSQVEVKLQEKDGKCGITLNHERIGTRAEADGLRAGWGAALQELKELLER